MRTVRSQISRQISAPRSKKFEFDSGTTRYTLRRVAWSRPPEFNLFVTSGKRAVRPCARVVTKWVGSEREAALSSGSGGKHWGWKWRSLHQRQGGSGPVTFEVKFYRETVFFRTNAAPSVTTPIIQKALVVASLCTPSDESHQK